MKLSRLHEEFLPMGLLTQLSQGIGKNYFAHNLPMTQAPKDSPKGNSQPGGLGGGNYGAQLKPRHKTYFGGLHGA